MIDGRAEHSIVSSYLKRSEIGEAEVLVYNLVTSPLAVVLFLYRYYLPVVIASLGLYIGGLYVLFSPISSLVSLIIGIVYGRAKLKNINVEEMIFRKERGEKVNVRKSVKTAASFTKKGVEWLRA